MTIDLGSKIKVIIEIVGLDFKSGNWSVSYSISGPFGMSCKGKYAFDRHSFNENTTPSQVINALKQKLHKEIQPQLEEK